ncbi:MAG: NUDIX hydrolase [bacterium]|nr:NUDIX hydrolase [bacterium]
MSSIFKGRVITACSERVTLPNGIQTDFDIVKHPGGACVLCVFENGDILLIRQYRNPAKDYLWEFPAGRLEKKEDPLNCAKRELQEEAGIEAKEWKKLGVIYTSPGFCDEQIHLFLATGLKEVEKALEPYEVIVMHRLSEKKVREMMVAGEIRDGKTLAALALYWDFPKKPKKKG